MNSNTLKLKSDYMEIFVLEKQLVGRGRTQIGSDESLISTGILDSMALLQLVVLIEERFGVTVEGADLIPDNFETINSIKTFVETKQQAA